MLIYIASRRGFSALRKSHSWLKICWSIFQHVLLIYIFHCWAFWFPSSYMFFLCVCVWHCVQQLITVLLLLRYGWCQQTWCWCICRHVWDYLSGMIHRAAGPKNSVAFNEIWFSQCLKTWGNVHNCMPHPT